MAQTFQGEAILDAPFDKDDEKVAKSYHNAKKRERSNKLVGGKEQSVPMIHLPQGKMIQLMRIMIHLHSMMDQGAPAKSSFN